MPRLSTAKLRGLLDHLDDEARMLNRIQSLTAGLTESGPASATLAERQPELSLLMTDLAELQRRRQGLRSEVAASWNCPADEVRLSRIELPSPQADQALHARRRELIQLAIQTITGIRATQSALGGWLAIIHCLLGAALAPDGDRDRYCATGQRVVPPLDVGISLRS